MYRESTMYSRFDEAENQISDLEHKEAKNTQSEQQKEKRIQKNKNVLGLHSHFLPLYRFSVKFLPAPGALTISSSQVPGHNALCLLYIST